MKQHASKSQRTATLPPACGDWHRDIGPDPTGSPAQWKVDIEHYLLGLGGQFNVQAKAQ